MTTLKRLFACVSFAFAVFAADAMTLYWQGDFVPASGVETSPTEWQITLLDAGKVSREVVSAALASNDVEKLSQALELGKVYSTTGCTYSTTGDGYWVVQKAPISSDYEKTNSVTFYTLILDKAPAANQTGYYILTDLKTDNALTFGNQCTMALGDLSKAVWTAYPVPVSEDGTVNLFWSGISVPRTGIQTVPGSWEITLLDAAKVPRSEMAAALASNDYTVISAALLKGMVVSTTGRVQNASSATSGKFGRWYWDNYSGKMPAEYTWAKYHETNSLSFYTLILDRKLDTKQTGHYILSEEQATHVAQIGTQCQMPFGSFASAKWSGYTTSGDGSVEPEPDVPLGEVKVAWTGLNIKLDTTSQTDGDASRLDIKLIDASKVSLAKMKTLLGKDVSYTKLSNAIEAGLVVSTSGVEKEGTHSVAYADWSYEGALPEEYDFADGVTMQTLKCYTIIFNQEFGETEGRYMITGEKTFTIKSTAEETAISFGSQLSNGWKAYSFSAAADDGDDDDEDAGDDDDGDDDPEDEPEEPVLDFSVAQVYNGYIVDDGLALKGTIQVKAARQKVDAKAGLTTSVLTIKIQLWEGDATKLTTFSLKGTMDLAEAEIALATKDYRELDLAFTMDGMTGGFDGYTVIGARDVFSSKAAADKALATSATALWKEPLACAWLNEDSNGYNNLSFSIGSKGRIKVAGVVEGQKVSTTAQMLVDAEGNTVLPVVSVKKNLQLAFVVSKTAEGEVAVEGLTQQEVLVGAAETFESAAVFSLADGSELLAYAGDDAATYLDYLPNGIEITQKKTKWVLPKAGKVVLKKGEIDESKLLENPAGLKLAYRSKAGTFSGSFKAYIDYNGRLKSVTVSVSGILIDGQGYGTATIKKKGSVAVTIEPRGED